MRVSSKWQPHPRPLSVFLARYAKRRPNVQVNLTEAAGASLIALLERGEVHVAISTAGGIQASNVSLGTIWLPSLEFVAAYNRALGLANRPTMDVRKLGSFPLLLLESSFAIRAAFAACRIAEFKPNIAFESPLPTPCWRSRRPVTESRLCHRSCPPIATTCRLFDWPL